MSNRADVMRGNRRMLIGGGLVEALSGTVMEVVCPGDASSLGQVPAADDPRLRRRRSRHAEQLAKIFPPGVVNVMSGAGREAGAALVRHPGIQAISFTGSVATGRAIAAVAAERFLPLGLELGGKKPMIVCADADIPEAVAAAVRGMNYGTQGPIANAPTVWMTPTPKPTRHAMHLETL